jgi:hypothetical protein
VAEPVSEGEVSKVVIVPQGHDISSCTVVALEMYSLGSTMLESIA